MWIKKSEYDQLQNELIATREKIEKIETTLDKNGFYSFGTGLALSHKNWNLLYDDLGKNREKIQQIENERDYYKKKYEMELEKRIKSEDKT